MDASKSLKQCSICGAVFACEGFAITLSDNDGILSELRYPVTCPPCYSSVLKAIVMREQDKPRKESPCQGVSCSK